ncbi:glycosyltransferase [Flavonifractor sp. An306]|uniref:glycosyltransferase family 2 protein n=1 Tax=Flavonifractor sp. An306 TaxID=1965629 RepID=UPI000B36C0DD|nr:glycosyltransferase [Flavonifractor sp. An306]OUO34617.1 hypothetical protein B5F88_15695 [Flavonifractor sp. An306]
MKKASIIVTVDTEYPLVSNFFQLLFQTHDMSEYELIVVDDHCPHLETVEYLRRLSQEERIDQLIILEDKQGFGRANNAGIMTSTTEYLVLINTDILLRGHEINRLLDRMKELGCQAIQPLLLYPQSGRIQSCGHIFGHLFNRHALEYNTPECLAGQRAIERQALTPAFCIVEKNAFMEVGCFDSFYYNSFEGLDLTLSLHLKSRHCVVAPDIQAYHIRMASRSATFFNEEQQNPYFWSKYAPLVKDDYIDCVAAQLSPEQRSRDYLACCLTHLDLLSEVQEAGLRISEAVNLQQAGSVELFGTLPYSFLHTVYPLLFLCEHINQLSGNRLWMELRAREEDLVIDSAGNVIPLCKL